MRGDGTRLREHLAAADVFLLGAAQERADVVARLALIEELAEHLDAGDRRLGRRLETDDLDFVAHLDDAALDATGHDRAAAFDREDVLDRHEERLVKLALRLGDVGVQRIHELGDAFARRIVGAGGLGGGIRRTADHGRVVAIVVVLGKELAHFHLDEVEHLGVIDEVALVEEDDDLRHADLAGEQHVLAGLRHRAVDGGHDEDRAIHLRGAGDHVLDVVGVAGAVDVRVVAVRRGILDVRGGDRQNLGRVTTARGLGSLRDLVVLDLLAEALEALDVGDSGRQRGLAVVDVADGADVHVRLSAAIECFFCHFMDSCELLFFFLSPPRLEPPSGIEPPTSSLPRMCSTY